MFSNNKPPLVLAGCSGSGTSKEYDPSCDWDADNLTYECSNPYTTVTTYCSGASEAFCYRQGDFWDNECMSGGTEGCQWSGLSRSSDTKSGCVWTPPPTPTPCTPSCSATRCGTVSNGCGTNCACRECQTEKDCGTTNWDCKTATCNECEDCSPACGQAKDCGGTCSNAANGAPVAPTPISPLGSLLSPVDVNVPVILTWNHPAKADKYEIYVKNLDTGVSFSRVDINALTYSLGDADIDRGYRYEWGVRGVNNTCDRDAGPYAIGYFKPVCIPGTEGIPDIPTCTSLAEIQTSLPVIVRWTTGGVLTDKYEYRFDMGATSSTTSLRANWNVGVGGTHNWQSRAVNLSCGIERSPFSEKCTFCYENACTPACGQMGMCAVCPNTDDGYPPAPVLVNPGTETNPISRLPGPITLKWAPASTDVLSDRWRILLTNIGNGKTISFPALDVGISKQLVDDALLATGRVYSWEVWGTNNDCPPTKWGAKAIGYFVLNSPPTVTGLRLSNCNGVNVPSETIGSTSRNQICQDAFRECTNPREVTFKAQVSDPEGWANISGATLYGMDKDYPMTKLTGSGLAGTMAVTVNFTDLNVKFDNQLGVGVSDIFGATGGDLFRYWKVWDCLVSVTGTIYENSPLSVGRCNPLHYTTPVTSSLGFKKLIFDDEVAANPDKQMDVVQPATYSGLNNINKLIWGSEYIPLFNDGSRGGNENGTLNGTTRKTRVIETTISGAGTTFCPPLNTFPVNLGTTTALSEYIVSPYKNNPQAMIDFSFFILPEGWFQVSGGGIKTKRDLRSGVPVGVVAPEIQALSIARVDADNGLITYGGAYTNNSGNTNLNFGDPNNWYEGVNANDSVKYGYQYFYDNFLVKAGIGIMATDWGSIASHTTDGGIFFVNGDLAINSDFTLAAGKTMIVIVKGDIAIGNNVKRIDGIYISEGGISASGTSVDQLVINGSLYSLSSVSFSRGYVNPSLNPTKPAVKINYQPSYMFNMPGILMRVLSGWREE